MLYYANRGPGPASKLLRVDTPDGGGSIAWHSAPAWRWNVKGGWRRYADAQVAILMSGDLFLIDASQVLDVQHEMLLTYERFHAK